MPRRIVLDPDGDVCLRLQAIPKPSDTGDEPGDNEPTEQDDDVHSDDLEQSDDAHGRDLGQDDSAITRETDLTLDLIVSSKILTTASPPFKAMLYGRFKEGLDLAASTESGTPYLLKLPDDNSQAALTLCALIHHKRDHVPEVVTPEDLWELARFSDKYMCLRVLKYAGKSWIRHQVEEMLAHYKDAWSTHGATEDLCVVLHVAQTLDLPHEFALCLGALVSLIKGEDSLLLSSLEYAGFGRDMFDCIQELLKSCRDSIHEEMMNVPFASRDVMDATDTTEAALHTCEVATLGRYILALRNARIYPGPDGFRNIALHRIFDQAPYVKEDVKLALSHDRLFRCSRGDPCAAEWQKSSVYYHYSVDGLVNRTQGMKDSILGRVDFWDYRQCLDCLKAGGPPDEERTHTCRISHGIEGSFGDR